MPAENVILRINGEDWQGWTNCQITRQLDAVSGSFSIGLTRRVEFSGKVLSIATGAPCELLAGDSPLINGYIGRHMDSGARSSHAITITGRDKSGDIVDCSAVHSPGQWFGLHIGEIAQLLCEPFGVPVSLECDPGPAFPVFKLEWGETALDALERALRQRELFALPSNNGGIRLAEIGVKSSSTPLIHGENVLSWSWSDSEEGRFSDYLVEGQQPGTDDAFGISACAVSGNANDTAITRYRPLLIRAENQVNRDGAARRAAWEKTVRAGRARSLEVTLAGWRQQNGELWDVNLLVPVVFPYFEIEDDLLISKVIFEQSRAAGTICKLSLSPRDAFTPEPEEAKQAAQEPGASKAYSQAELADWGFEE